MCQNSSRSVYSVALWRQNPNFCGFFGLRHLVVSPIGSSLKKLNMGVLLQTSPYPMVSKSLLYSNAFMAKSGAQTHTFKSVTDKQTKKLNVYGRPAAKSEPHQTWHGDRGPRTRSCTSKTFGDLTHSFAARGRSKFGDNQTPST